MSREISSSKGKKIEHLKVRPFAPADIKKVVNIAQRNFRGHSYSLFADAVVNAYVKANSPNELRTAMQKQGTESYVIEDGNQEVSGYFFLRYPGTYGEMDLRRTQVDPDKQGKGIAKKIITTVEKRGTELGAKSIATQGGGASRDYFERHGWRGRTILNSMEPVPAVVFSCTKDLEEQTTSYTRPDKIIIASTNPRKIKYIRSLVGDMPVISMDSEESLDHDVVTVAIGKAQSILPHFAGSIDAAIVATDVRTDIMVYSNDKIVFANKGKPKTLEEATDNFAAMLQVAKATKKPVPYVVRSATAILDQDTNQQPLVSERDISVWLTQDALATLSDKEGFARYRQAVLDEYGRDVMQNAAGFALPFFVKKGMVAGINGYLFDKIPNREQVLQQAESIVYGVADSILLKQRLGAK